MRQLLESYGWPEFDHCDVPMNGSSEEAEMVSDYDNFDNSRYNGEHSHEPVRRSLGELL